MQGNTHHADMMYRCPNAAGDVSTFVGELTTAGSATGIAPVARLNQPHGVVFSRDSQLMYLSDSQNHVIRVMEMSNRFVRVLTGTAGTSGAADGSAGAALFNTPRGLAISLDDSELYVVDTLNHAIRVVDIATGAVSTLAGGGGVGLVDDVGTAARFHTPQQLSLDGPNLYVVDQVNHAIRTVNIATGAVSTLASGFANPHSCTLDGDTLYVGETNAVRAVNVRTGLVSILAGDPAAAELYVDGAASDARFRTVTSLVRYRSMLYLTEYANHAIRTVDLETGEVATFAGAGGSGAVDGAATAARFNTPVGAAIAGSTLYVAEKFNTVIRAVALSAPGAPPSCPRPSAMAAWCKAGGEWGVSVDRF